MKTHILLVSLAAIFLAAACGEEERFKISNDDNVPPGNPIFVDSEPLPGGSRVYYLVPDDEDFLYIEADYENAFGEELFAISSYFATYLDIYGYLGAGEHTVTLKSVDRAGNKSPGIKAIVLTDEAPVETVAGTVELLPSFDCYLVRWQNLDHFPLYVSIRTRYAQGGQSYDFSSDYATSQSETQSVDNLFLHNGETVTVGIELSDKYGNSVTLQDSSIVLLVDDKLDKSIWALPEPGTEMGGAIQANGNVERGDMDYLYDDITEADGAINYYQTNADNPWNVIVDLGRECRLSRILTHQRYSGNTSITANNIQGAYYRDENVLSYNMYIWDAATSSWQFIRRHDITVPSVKDASEYKTLGDAGDEAFLYPEEPCFSAPTRYFRLEAISGTVMSELTIFGEYVD